MSKIQHVYGLFESPEDAMTALALVQARGCSTEHCSAILHEKHIDESMLSTSERASREGALDGAAIGGTAGAIIGGLAALGGGILGVGPLAAVALAAGTLGGYGAMLGGISGSDDAEKHLRALYAEVENGKILIAVETDDSELEKMCETIFAEHGGRQVVC
ncbi:hypothetical protein [Enhygromyxa salina]|nr:hypothetical protein [Enhygromyxa salina]